MGSDFIPNSFQTPNAYVDKYMAYLTPEEYMVLSYFVRRIFGFHKRQDRIAYSQIMDGLKTKDGDYLDYGTGLGMSATENAVKGLLKYRLVIKVEENDEHKNEGPLYALQLDSTQVDVNGLVDRKQLKEEKHKARMSKAREARQMDTPGTNEQTRHYPLEGGCHYPIEGGVPLSNNVHNNQGNPVENHSSTSTPPAGKIITEAQAETIYRKITGFMSMPSIGRDTAIGQICDIAREKGDGTAEYCIPFFEEYKTHKSLNGRLYSPGGYGWLDWACTGVIPPKDPPPQQPKTNGNGRQNGAPPPKENGPKPGQSYDEWLEQERKEARERFRNAQ